MAQKYSGLRGRKIVMFFILVVAMLAVFFGGSLLIDMMADGETAKTVGNVWMLVVGACTGGIGQLINAIAQHNPQGGEEHK
jgi:hypothetical protein